MNKEKNTLIYENENTLAESNRLIKSRYYATTMENKMLAFGMARLQEKLRYSDDMEVSFSTAEIGMLTGVNDNTRKYNLIKRTASKLNTMNVMVENEKKDGFESMALVPNCSYENGTFKMEFNRKLKGVIYQVRKDFTLFPLETIAAFENKASGATLRIYQYLKMEIQKAANLRKKKEIRLSYTYEEFVLNIGQINTEIEEIRSLIEKKAPAKYIVDKAVEIHKNGVKCAVSVASKADFKRHVLMPALEEINSKSELEVELVHYVGKGKGGGNNIDLRVALKPDREFESIEDERYWDCIAGFPDYVPELRLSEDGESIRSIIKAANYDLGRIRDVRSIITKMPYVKNFVGAMIEGLNSGWDKGKNVSLVKGFDASFYEELAEEVNEEFDIPEVDCKEIE